jgi:transcriptional regulator with XRE-family HTH domain
MSSTAGKLPNERFRRERQRRGWSREYIAEQIGIADAKTIGRWERGVAFPRAYYLQKLCALFEMFAVDLGFFQEEAQHITPDEPASLYRLPLYDPAIPSHVGKTACMCGQDKLLEQMKHGLCAGGQSISSALYGMQGVGKTTLAIELVHDCDVQRFFQDGILWVELGHRPNIPELLRRWGILLGLTPVETASLTTVSDLAGVLQETIGMRRMLLVIDDARHSGDALAFKLGGPCCAYILTTRVAAVALDFANDRAMLMRELTSDAGLLYLERLTQVRTPGESGPSASLVGPGDGFSPIFRLS